MTVCYLKSFVLSSCIYFLVEDKEGPAVNCEKNLTPNARGGGQGGDVDECSLGEHKCDSNAECINNVGT